MSASEESINFPTNGRRESTSSSIELGELPVYKVKPESGDGPSRTLHRDLLLPCSFLTDSDENLPSPEHSPVQRPRTRQQKHLQDLSTDTPAEDEESESLVSVNVSPPTMHFTVERQHQAPVPSADNERALTSDPAAETAEQRSPLSSSTPSVVSSSEKSDSEVEELSEPAENQPVNESNLPEPEEVSVSVDEGPPEESNPVEPPNIDLNLPDVTIRRSTRQRVPPSRLQYSSRVHTQILRRRRASGAGRNGVFELVLSKVTTSDDGTYGCTGTEWSHEASGQWLQIVESTKEMGPVTVTPISQSLTITASSVSPLTLTPGESMSLLCSVAVDNLALIGLEISWLSGGRDLITMDRNGVIAVNKTNYRADASLERVDQGKVRLSVRGVSIQDAGAYSCRVRAWVEKGEKSALGKDWWHMAAEKMSTTVNVKVAQIRSSPQSSTLIGSLDAVGNLKAGPSYSDRLDKGTITLTRVQPNTFKLRFLRAQKADMGQYTCRVSASTLNSQGGYVDATEQLSPALPIKWEQKSPQFSVALRSDSTTVFPWETAKMECAVSVSGSTPKSVTVESITVWCSCYVSPSTKTWTKAEELTSSRIFLTVKFAVLWDSLKMPLLYGAAAALGVGLFSLIFGLVCANCCCRNTKHTPLSARNKLLHLEMD
ncbi:hypothetical protein WMY93_022224 [Mugilogobius chulae]|uniref:Ig-like domain-containing protein n=1 Tax=Mugilogobius chulae TaxID=88201 RepID=A0AAW0NHJ8_9GOBI